MYVDVTIKKYSVTEQQNNLLNKNDSTAKSDFRYLCVNKASLHQVVFLIRE